MRRPSLLSSYIGNPHGVDELSHGPGAEPFSGHGAGDVFATMLSQSPSLSRHESGGRGSVDDSMFDSGCETLFMRDS